MRWWFLHPAGFLAVTLLLAQCAGVAGTAGGGPRPLIDPVVRNAVSAGRSRVFVELRITPAFRPEGELPNAAAIADQRQTIAKAQSDLLSRLAGTKFSIAHQYDSVPMLALEIGDEALSRLEASGDLVARVLPDATRAPQA